MTMLSKRYIVVVLMLVVFIFIGHALKYDSGFNSESAVEAVKKIPKEHKDWHGRDVFLDPTVYEILDTRAVIHREYINSKGQSVFLSVVYYADTKVDFHTPEGCLGGKGIRAKKFVKPVSLMQDAQNISFDVAEIKTNDNGKMGIVYYFYKAGQFVGQNYIKMRFNIALNKFISKNKSGALIRISTNLASNGEESGEAVLKGFLNDFFLNFNSNL